MRHIRLDVTVTRHCEKELLDFPEDIRGDVLDCIARLSSGLLLSMPLSKPMPSIGRGVHELRFHDRSGQYRVIYVLIKGEAIFLVHAFEKKTQQTPRKNREIAMQRIKSL